MSVFERSLSLVEINALYNDDNIHNQNTSLLSDASASYDLTNKDNIPRLEITDISENGNRLNELGTGNIDYDGETSVLFESPNNELFRRVNMLKGNIDSTINLWLLINKQTRSAVNTQRIFTLGEGTTYLQSSLRLTLENTDNNLYALSYGVDALSGDLTAQILIPDY